LLAYLQGAIYSGIEELKSFTKTRTEEIEYLSFTIETEIPKLQKSIDLE